MYIYIAIAVLFIKCCFFNYNIGGDFEYSLIWLAFIVAASLPFHNSPWGLWCLNFWVSVGTVGILVYNDSFHILPTWTTANELRVFPEPGRLIIDSFRLIVHYLPYNADVAVFGILLIINKKRRFIPQSTKLPANLVFYSAFVIGYFFIHFNLSSGNEPGKQQISSINQLAKITGNIGYAATVWLMPGGKIELTGEQRAKIDAWYKAKETSNPGQGQLTGKNIVFLQVESLEAFVVGHKVNGQEVTPNINKLLPHSQYYKVQEQTRRGNTSDAEHISNTGVFPAQEEAAFISFPNTSYPDSLPRLFERKGYSTLSIHPTNSELWNWREAMQSIGFQKTIDRYYFKDMEAILFGLADEPFLRESANILNEQKQPYFAFMITASSHFPFIIPDKEKTLNLPDTKLNQYLQVIHYADMAIGKFIQKLPPDTVIILIGDHEGIHKFYPEEPAPANDKQVPFIIYHPSIKGQEMAVKGGQIDILPTIAGLFGIETPKAMGRDLATGTGTPASTKGNLQIADLIIRGDYWKSEHHALKTERAGLPGAGFIN